MEQLSFAAQKIYSKTNLNMIDLHRAFENEENKRNTLTLEFQLRDLSKNAITHANYLKSHNSLKEKLMQFNNIKELTNYKRIALNYISQQTEKTIDEINARGERKYFESIGEGETKKILQSLGDMVESELQIHQFSSTHFHEFVLANAIDNNYVNLEFETLCNQIELYKGTELSKRSIQSIQEWTPLSLHISNPSKQLISKTKKLNPIIRKKSGDGKNLLLTDYFIKSENVGKPKKAKLILLNPLGKQKEVNYKIFPEENEDNIRINLYQNDFSAYLFDPVKSIGLFNNWLTDEKKENSKEYEFILSGYLYEKKKDYENLLEKLLKKN